MRFLAGAAIGLFAVAGCHKQTADAEQSKTSDPVPVTVAEAVRLDVPVQVRAIGWGEAYATVSIKARVEGQITDIKFTEGQMLKAGDHLFSIDGRPFEARTAHGRSQPGPRSGQGRRCPA